MQVATRPRQDHGWWRRWRRWGYRLRCDLGRGRRDDRVERGAGGRRHAAPWRDVVGLRRGGHGDLRAGLDLGTTGHRRLGVGRGLTGHPSIRHLCGVWPVLVVGWIARRGRAGYLLL